MIEAAGKYANEEEIQALKYMNFQPSVWPFLSHVFSFLFRSSNFLPHTKKSVVVIRKASSILTSAGRRPDPTTRSSSPSAMAHHHTHRDSSPATFSIPVSSKDDDDPEDIVSPFHPLAGLEDDDIRQAAYEIFFTVCRSSPGFGGRHALIYYSSVEGGGGEGVGGSTVRGNGVGIWTNSKVKRALGLKTLRRFPSRRTASFGSGRPSSPSSPSSNCSCHNTAVATVISPAKVRRPLTSAEIMRQQMKVSEINDSRLRKTLMRTLVGQMGRRAETIILPLELLRHLKPSEFANEREYHNWQKRQLKVLEAGLLLHPAVTLDKSDPFAVCLRDIIQSANFNPIDTNKNSDAMRTLCNAVVYLAWRGPNSSATEVCHWADGYPSNTHMYVSLLGSIFDGKEETMVVDEVDELLELMKKTWSILGINKQAHTACLLWVLFRQYIVTGQTEGDLLGACGTLLSELSVEAKRGDVLLSVAAVVLKWAEKRMTDYHLWFGKGSVRTIEVVMPLALSASMILGGDGVNVTLNKVDFCIRSSMNSSFSKLMEGRKLEEDGVWLLHVAKETEGVAEKERRWFSPVMKKWHPTAMGVAAVTLHGCFGREFRRYLVGMTLPTNEVMGVVQRAGEVEKLLTQMVVDDCVECEDGGKGIVREMVPYEVNSIITKLLRTWIDDQMKKARELIHHAKDTETWNSKSKSEQYSTSVVDLVKFAKQTVEDFFEIQVGIPEDMLHLLADGLQSIFRDYISSATSCGCKQNYIPILPPLTRCNRDSKLLKLLKKAAPCSIPIEDGQYHNGTLILSPSLHHHPRPSMSRGTQRLYTRINSLHYFLSHLHPLEKTISLSPHSSGGRRTPPNFDRCRSAIQVALEHISTVAAYRLIFLDSHSVFYETLYTDDVADNRIRPAIRILKQNMTLICGILTDGAQLQAVREVMKASFEAFLTVLLAGGSSRVFSRTDNKMVQEDFESLRRVFCSCGEGLIGEDDVTDREVERVDGVIGLMGETTERLIEEFSISAYEMSGIGVGGRIGDGQSLLRMPPTTGRWQRSDPNTILRVLCHRDDEAANRFLKKSFQLGKRR